MSDTKKSQPVETEVLSATEAKALLDKQLQRYTATKRGVTPEVHALFNRSMTVGGGGNMLRAAKGVAAQAIKTADVTEIIALLDMSTSMIGQEKFVIQSLNEMIDDLANERNAERNKIYLTIWTFTNNQATLVYANQLITKARHITPNDYDPHRGGTTPLYKTVIMAMGGGSLRTEVLRTAEKGHRKTTKTLLVTITDDQDYNPRAADNEKFTKKDVHTVVSSMLSTERWVIGLAFAGTQAGAQAAADGLGIPSVRTISRDRNGWRTFFQIVSQSATQLSAPTSIAASVQNSFMSSS